MEKGAIQFLASQRREPVKERPARAREVSPSPWPSPSEGEGRPSRPARESRRRVSPGRRRRLSLSQRERAGVRVKARELTLRLQETEMRPLEIGRGYSKATSPESHGNGRQPGRGATSVRIVGMPAPLRDAVFLGLAAGGIASLDPSLMPTVAPGCWFPIRHPRSISNKPGAELGLGSWDLEF